MAAARWIERASMKVSFGRLTASQHLGTGARLGQASELGTSCQEVGRWTGSAEHPYFRQESVLPCDARLLGNLGSSPHGLPRA